MSGFDRFLLHICVICSLVGITAKILDWYNPFMDFAGHVGYVQMVLYVAVILIALTEKDDGHKKGVKTHAGEKQTK